MPQSVVLPAPLGPTRPMRSRSAMRQVTSRKTSWPPNPLETSSSWITAARSPHALDLLGRDRDGHADLARLAAGVRVLAEVFLGQRVDVIVGALLRHSRHAPADLQVAVRILRVLDRDGHARIALEVLVLHAPARGVEADVGAVEVDPHRRHLRRAVGADGGDVSERLLALEEI